MIDFPNKEELQELESFSEPGSLTAYATFDDPSSTILPNRIGLKNLLFEARERLTAAGLKCKDVDKALKPAFALADNSQSLPRINESLAMFIHPNFFRYYHLPARAAVNLISVGKGFNVGPLKEIMEQNKSYLVLSLGHKNVCLYEGDRFKLKRVRMKDFPSNLVESLRIDEYPNETELHPVGPVGTSQASEGFHGHYNKKQTDKKLLLEFFRQIDHRIREFLTNKNQPPLILAGVNYLLPIYRKANTYPRLLPIGILGNQENVNRSDLVKKAWRIAKMYI